MNKLGRLKSGSKKTNINGIEQLEKIVELYRSEQIVISLILDYMIEKFNIDKNELDKYVKEKIATMLNTMNEDGTQSDDTQPEQDDTQQTETDDVVEDVKN
jgi:hypothetical protein